MSSLHFIHIAQQIELIFIVVIKMKVLREESKGKATNNLLTLYTFLVLSCLQNPLPRKKCCFGAVDLAPFLKKKAPP